jgi:RNA polymerase sigma factor (sigma-70 family)
MADMDKGQVELVRRLQADRDDAAAQRELHELYRARLVGFCRTGLTDPNDAEDCAQEIFQDVFTGIEELRDPAAFEAWMFTIARRKIGGYNARRRPAEPADADGIPDLPDPVTDVEHDVRMRELLGTITDAIDSLPSPLDAVLKAYIGGGGLRGSELAPRFGWDTKKADHELNRARQGLFDALETLVVVRTGRQACADLNKVCARQRIRPGRMARLSQDQRRSVHRHITQCAVCRPQARAARDRGQWALGPGIAQLAELLHRRRRGVRLVAATAVTIAMVALPATSDWVPPGETQERNVVAVPPAPPVPPPSTPAPTPPPPRKPVPRPKPPPAPRSTDVAPPTAPAGNGGAARPRPSPPQTRPPARTPRTPPPKSPPPPPRATPSTSPPAGPRCTTTIALNPLTVRLNAVVLCVSVSVGGD